MDKLQDKNLTEDELDEVAGGNYLGEGGTGYATLPNSTILNDIIAKQGTNKSENSTGALSQRDFSQNRIL